MKRMAWALAGLSLVTACSGVEAVRPSDVPALNVSAAAPGVRVTAGDAREILMLDQCDPVSFNAVIGPGTCVNRSGGLTFDLFIALLQQQSRVPSWRFSPDAIHVPRQLTLSILNRGGETHTFTEVEAFGGGIVPDLNALSGTPVPAPECLALGAGDFVAAGAATSHTFEPGDSDKYQCCIHPWMRAVTR